MPAPLKVRVIAPSRVTMTVHDLYAWLGTRADAGGGTAAVATWLWWRPVWPSGVLESDGCRRDQLLTSRRFGVGDFVQAVLHRRCGLGIRRLARRGLVYRGRLALLFFAANCAAVSAMACGLGTADRGRGGAGSDLMVSTCFGPFGGAGRGIGGWCRSWAPARRSRSWCHP